MDPTPAEPPPGCLVLLLRLSDGMTRDVVTPRGEVPALVAARLLADELVEGLVNTVAAGYAVGALDVAVLGYRAPDEGSPQLLSLLADGDLRPRFVPLAQVAEVPADPRDGEGLPRKWTGLEPLTGAGEPAAGAALASVYQMVSVWLTGRYASRPPVVIHCAGADGYDDGYFRVARSLSLLATAHGPARLLHYVFDPAPADDLLARLSDASAALTARRGLFVNEWDISDPWDALFTCAPLEDPTDWAGAGPGLARACAMWAQKMGNTPEQWEDAYALDEANGAAAIADGASTGIYCNIWAQQLSQRFLSDRPDVRDPAPLNKWVNGLRAEWRAAINYDGLNWSKQAKVDQTGAAATLLGLEVGPADAAGARPWRACAVGDASLFWVRRGELLATFPVVAADQFGSAPLLVRSSPGYRTVTVAAAGACEPGDRFVLATDAVAARLFKSTATDDGVDWGRFEGLAEADWRAELDTLRRENDMVNDDCTLVVLCVTAPTAAVSDQQPLDVDAVAPESEDVPIAAEVGEDVPPADDAPTADEDVPLAAEVPVAAAVSEDVPMATEVPAELSEVEAEELLLPQVELIAVDVDCLAPEPPKRPPPPAPKLAAPTDDGPAQTESSNERPVAE